MRFPLFSISSLDSKARFFIPFFSSLVIKYQKASQSFPFISFAYIINYIPQKGMSLSKKSEQKDDKIIEEPIQTVDGCIRIKKYIKLKQVGSGSYSKCFLVRNKDSESTYVAKIIPKKKLQILQKEKLIYQIKIHQSLSHQNVVHLDHWFEDETNQYIFMEYCPNGNLEMRLQRFDGNMPEKQIKKYGAQIVNAINYIHSQNILHRDLKLCNFYLDVNNDVKLGDFGFACQLASQYDKKRQTCGTPNYIAPQAISGFGYSFSSDVWAIGVILFRLKYGCCPFEGQTVKKTLQNVKICNFKFPSKPKICAQLKDLIQKILNLNYDDRLTTNEILEHKFFTSELVEDSKSKGKQEKRGFSLSRLFSLDKNKEKGKKQESTSKKQIESSQNRQNLMERQTRNQNSQKKQEQPKRSNSCQTFKQIKQIFKNKSKPNLVTSTGVQSKKDTLISPYYTLNTVTATQTNREKQLMSTKTNRLSVLQYSNSVGLNQSIDGNRKQESNRSNRLNQFIKSHVNSASVKEQLKMTKLNNSKGSINIPGPGQIEKNDHIKQSEQIQHSQNSNSTWLGKNNTKVSGQLGSNYINPQKIVKVNGNPSIQQQLNNFCRKYYLPLSLQQQKDVLIIHYRPTVKQVVYNNNSIIMHRTTQNLFKLNGDAVSSSQLPKVLKYIIENKVEIKEYQSTEDYEYLENNINKIMHYLPQSLLSLKDGLILRYGNTSNLVVAKLFNQQGFYLVDENNQGLMYSVDSTMTPKILEGIVVMRIYSGWVKTYNKK